MNVTVFGGSQPPPGSSTYVQACELGRLLATRGHTVLTGGYIGTMEAVSRGAAEAGGHVIGVTCDEIEAWRPVAPNAWVQEERRFASMQERLNELVRACQAAIALPGGPGTLTEIAFTWNLMIVHSIPQKPLILMGAAWKRTFDSFYQSFRTYIPETQRDFISFAATIEDAVNYLPKQKLSKNPAKKNIP